MIAEKIKLLKSIKEHQFSKLITIINEKILETLQSHHFNPRMAPYLNKINKDGVPFTNYDLDPDNISQIKKLINALYYARLTFEDLEYIDIEDTSRTYADLKLIYGNTIHQSYQACYLLTHLDVDVKDMFSEELQLLLPMAKQLMAFANNHSEETKEFAETLQTYPISYKVGEVTGIAVDQMQPNSSELDYKFLTQFSAVLPGYIDQLTQYIKKYSSEIAEREPTLNNEKLEELQTAALKLLNDLENLKGSSLFLSFKVLNYIHIIRNIITLSMTSLEQMEHFSDSSQDVIRDNLAQLKYVVLPTLFGLVDKIEDNTMLKPGTLSNPLMEKIKPLYELLIHYASKPVNFQEKGEELLSIEDSRFLALRLERTYGRIDAANKALFKIKKAEKALTSFYEILDNPLYKDLALHQLPQETKNQLIAHYKLLRPYMTHIDFDFNDRIIDSLNGPETYRSWLATPWRWLRSQLPADHLSFIIERKIALQTLISKKRATQEFHINLNIDLISSVKKQTNLVLFPYSDQTNVFAIDESKALNPGHTCALFKLANQYQLKLIPKVKYTPQTLYLEATEQGLKYDVIGLRGTVETALIPWDKLTDVPHDVASIIASKNKYLPKLLELTSKAGHTQSTAKLRLKAKEKREPQTLYIQATENGLKYEVINLEGTLETALIPWKKLTNARYGRGTLYLEATEHGLKYDVIGLKGTVETALIPWEQLTDFPHDVTSIIASKNKYLPKLLELTSKVGHTQSTATLRLKMKEKPDPQALYFETTDDGLKYEVINLEGILETTHIPWKKLTESPHDVSTILASKDQFLTKLLKITSQAGQTLSPTGFEFDEIKGLLKGRSAVILLNNNELIYADSINQSLRKLESTEKNQFSFAQLKASFTDSYKMAVDNELKLITAVTEHPHLEFKQVNGENRIANPENLTADQALDLCQWYRNKRDRFMEVKDAYDEFMPLLKAQVKTPAPGQSENSLLDLNTLDKTVKDQCRILYNQFQSYFINGVPEELKSSALEFDKYLVHAFSKKTIDTSAPTINMFMVLEVHFQEYFTKIDLNWRDKREHYLKVAHSKFASENDASTLEHDTSIGNRGHHLIQHTNYSKYVHTFRTELEQVILVFNNAMQAELRPQTSGIPFPELENKNRLLAQSKQVIAIKRIFNSLYHIEGIILELEKLNNRSSETIYVYHLLQAYGHIDEIMTLTKGLVADPHFSLIARELLEKAQSMYATIQEHSEAYQVAPNEVDNKPIQYNALWYVLNAFHISPKHIRSLRNNNYITAEELKELNVSAKKATIQIESIIKSSNSYFQLFLQTPNMISLYRNLTAKLNEFISTSHDTVANNLDQFRPKVFTPMLLEADHWEDKLGLIPGTISGPLKEVTDEYFKGLLHPLELDAKTHVDLICDKAPLEKRLQVTNKKIENAEKHLEQLEKNYKHVNALFTRIQSYEKFSGGLVPASQIILDHAKLEMFQAYQKALPKLVWLQKRVTVGPDRKTADSNFDDLLNSNLKDYEPKLTQIRELVTAGHNYYLGIKATYQMQLNTAKEKFTYLNELTKTQEKENLQFIEEYTNKSFNKQMEAFCNRHIGLQYTDKEYRNKLREYLLTFKAPIINQAKTTDDINLIVKNLLKEKIKRFEQDNFAQYFHLDTVRVALAQFKNYFSLSTLAIERNYSLFENEKTLGVKTEKINKLLEFAEDEKLTVEERFSKITFEVKDPSFSRIILAHKQEDHFSFTYLILCIVSLLETLHLYTPARKKLYNDLNDAVNNQPQINELTKRFGLFATSKTLPEPPSLAPEAPSDEGDNDKPTPAVAASA